MRREILFSLVLTFGAGAARAANSDFPQTQQTQSGGGSSDFSQVHPQPSQGDGDWTQSGEAAAGNQGAPAGQPNAAPPMNLQVGGEQGGSSMMGAQGGSKNMMGGRPGIEDQAGDGNGDQANGEGADEGGESGSSSMDLDSARVNFATVVAAFVAKKSPDGYWPYREKTAKKTARVLRLTRPSVAASSVKARGDNRYSGLVKLSDARGGRPVRLEFVVDFSGEEWKVVSVKPAPRSR